MFTKKKNTYTCSQCGNVGHNKQTCGNPALERKISPHSMDREQINRAVEREQLKRLAKYAGGKLKRDKDGEYYIKAKNVETTKHGTLVTEIRIRPEDVEEQMRYGGVVELPMGKNSYDINAPNFKNNRKRVGVEKATMYKVGDFKYFIASLFGLKRFLPKEVRHLKGGVYHNENGPAVYTENDHIKRELWYINGVKYRKDGGPSDILIRDVENPAGGEDLILTKELWTNPDGRHYREGAPATIKTRRDRSGNVIDVRETWYPGMFHRPDGPADVTYNGSGEIIDEQWYWQDQKSFKVDECRKAASPNTAVDELIELCQHDDPGVRSFAAYNPNCPDEWKTYVEIMK